MIDIPNGLHQYLERAANTLTELVGFYGSYPYSLQEVDNELRQGRRLGQRNVVGFGYGVKLVGGRPVDRISVTAHVVKKLSRLDQIETEYVADRYIRSRFSLPNDVDTDVIEVGNPEAFHNSPPVFTRRLPGGAHISNTVTRKGGTLGGWVHAPSSGAVFMLSCWHVLDGGSAQVGVSSVSHDSLPGTVGTLVASVAPTVGSVTVDAALAQLNIQWDGCYSDFVLQIGEIRGTTDFAGHRLPLHVRKYGMASDLSNGAIINATTPFALLFKGEKAPRRYTQQLEIIPDVPGRPFASPGDSGALVVTDDNLVIGLVVGGTPGYAIATPISAVLNSVSAALGTPVEFLTYP